MSYNNFSPPEPGYRQHSPQLNSYPAGSIRPSELVSERIPVIAIAPTVPRRPELITRTTLHMIYPPSGKSSPILRLFGIPNPALVARNYWPNPARGRVNAVSQ